MLSIGGFDPRFFMYEEDVEWCLRAIRKGYRILYQPNSLILHRAQGGSKTDAEEDRSDFWSTSNPRLTFYAFHIIRNRLLNVFAYANARQKLIVAVFFPLYMLRRAIPFLLGGRMDAVAGMLRGVVDAWRHRRPVAADPMI